MKKTSVLIVNEKLTAEPGKLVNAAFVIGLTSGRLAPDETFGPDVMDGEGSNHSFLTNIAHFVRKSSPGKMKKLRAEFAESPDVIIVDYTEAAAPSDYATYQDTLARQSAEEIVYRAIHVFGPEDFIIPRTKNLSRL